MVKLPEVLKKLCNVVGLADEDGPAVELEELPEIGFMSSISLYHLILEGKRRVPSTS